MSLSCSYVICWFVGVVLLHGYGYVDKFIYMKIGNASNGEKNAFLPYLILEALVVFSADFPDCDVKPLLVML